VLTGQIVAGVLVVGWLATGLGSTITQGRVSWFASIAFEVGVYVSAQRTARMLAAGNPARRFWWAMSGCAAATGAAYLSQLLITVDGSADVHTMLGGPVLRTLTGLGTAAVVIVMCTYPLRIRSGQQRVCFWLDMATVMVGAAAFGWYFASRGAFEAGGVRSGLIDILTGPVVMLVAVFAVAKLLVSGRPPFTAWTGILGAVAAGLGGVAGALGPTLMANVHGNWFFALSALGDAVLMIAARLQQVRIGADPQALERSRRRPYSTLPYVAIAATYVLLALAHTGTGIDGRTWIVLVAAIVSTGLVVARQLASFTDNARLLNELDAKVTELNRTEVVLRDALRERDVLAAQLHELAFRDSLTGLANRALFSDRLTNSLARARRGHTQLAVLLLDLDDFKPINDHHGHAAGDAVLAEVAVRLGECLRETDLVARLGGDEFGILLEGPVPADVEMVVERIERSVRRPFLIGGREMSVGVSVGVARTAEAGLNADELLRDADAAMYATKRAGKAAGSALGRPGGVHSLA
jgi:diguanylate cyclase (GGDEF)-like protein